MTVRLSGRASELASGAETIRAEGPASLAELIDWLGEAYGRPLREFLLEDGSCFFLVNGKGIMTTGGLSTPLRDEDAVEALPLVGGG